MLNLRQAVRHIQPKLARATLSVSACTAADGDPFIAHPSHHHLSSISSKEQLLKTYNVTPPIKPWPKNLHPKRLATMITCQQNLDLALQIFDYAGKFHPNFSHNYDTYVAIITKLSRARQFPHVEMLLSQLQTSDIKCGEMVFCTVIRNYGFASRAKDAVRIFIRIADFGVKRSIRSLNCLLNALVQNRKYDWVRWVFENSRNRFDVIPNIYTCNILVKALCRKGDMDGALKLLDEMPRMGMVPNVVTYTTIMGGYVQKGDMNSAKKTFGELFDRGWTPDALTYTTLMDGYCKKGELFEAIKIMDDMEENEVKPSEATYGLMIEAYCKVNRLGEAINLLNDMLKKYVPSSVLCCKVIDAMCREGKVEDAYALWKKLLKKNVEPDNAVSSTLIHWLCQKGKILEARKLFDEFERSTIPSLLTYNTLISGMCELGELCEAGRLWDDMVEKGSIPNAFTYNVLIKGFCKVGDLKEGMRVLEEMLVKGCVPDESTYSILIDGLSSLGFEDEILKLLKLVADSGGTIDAASWKVILTKCVSYQNTGANLDNMLAT